MGPRIGVLGGTFDPIHVGHVVAAAEARHELDLDRMLLMVAGDPWQKRGEVVASAADRLAVVEAVVADIDGLEACDLEVGRDGPTYTVDTVAALREQEPGAEVFLVVGADAADGIGSWVRAEELAASVTLVVVTRPGHPARAPDGFPRCEIVEIPALEVSSTAIRERLADGRPIDGLVPPRGVHCIRERRLYPGSG